MFVLFRNATILTFLTVTTLSLVLFGMVSFGSSEPRPPVNVNAVSGISAFPEITRDAEELRSKKFAVLIGVVYDNNDLGKVEFADWDAGSLYNLLTGRLGYPPENVVLLQNQNATHVNIRDAILWLAANPAIDADAEVVFYYSGHGLRNSPGGGLGGLDIPGMGTSYAIVPYDFKAYDYKNGTGLFFDSWLAEQLSRINPGRMWINIDSCFSGGYDRPGISGPNRVVTLSSQADQLSGEIPEARRGTFTQYLIEEGIARGLSVEDAFNEAAPRANSAGQNPLIADNYPGTLDFFRPPAKR